MSNQIDLRHLRYFLTVADELNFRKAATRLCISQPGLSRQIQQMEDLYKVKLFDRTKRSVKLSPAGKFLQQESQKIFDRLEQVKDKIKDISEGNEGHLKIGFLGSAAQKFVPDLLIKLSMHHPLLSTSLEEMSNKAQLDALLKQRLDIGFVRVPNLPAGIQGHLIFRDTFSVVLPPGFSHMPMPLNLSDLKEMPFVFFSSEDSPHYYDLIMSICTDNGFTPKVLHRSVNALSIFKLVEAGLGIAIVPTALKFGYDLNLTFVELEKVRQRTELYLVWSTNNDNPVLSKVLNICLE